MWSPELRVLQPPINAKPGIPEEVPHKRQVPEITSPLTRPLPPPVKEPVTPRPVPV